MKCKKCKEGALMLFPSGLCQSCEEIRVNLESAKTKRKKTRKSRGNKRPCRFENHAWKTPRVRYFASMTDLAKAIGISTATARRIRAGTAGKVNRNKKIFPISQKEYEDHMDEMRADKTGFNPAKLRRKEK